MHLHNICTKIVTQFYHLFYQHTNTWLATETESDSLKETLFFLRNRSFTKVQISGTNWLMIVHLRSLILPPSIYSDENLRHICYQNNNCGVVRAPCWLVVLGNWVGSGAWGEMSTLRSSDKGCICSRDSKRLGLWFTHWTLGLFTCIITHSQHPSS